VSAANQALGHVGAHPAKSDHSDIHRVSLLFR
jgi:hypothetical protein